MSDNILNVKLREAYDTEANWGSNNPVLLSGQIAISSDKNGKFKTGNGTSTWTQLQYNTSETAIYAEFATKDFAGQQIDSTYIKNLSVSGKTITYTRGDGSTGTITTQDTNTDTNVTNTLNTTTKAYITGTTSSITNTGTQVFDTGVYLDSVAGKLVATTFSGNSDTSDAEVEAIIPDSDIPS